MKGSSLQAPKKTVPKPSPRPRKAVEQIRYVKVEEIEKNLQKWIKEQIEIFPEFYDRLSQIELNQNIIVELLTEISVLLKGRVDVLNELDQKEMEVLDAILGKVKK